MLPPSMIRNISNSANGSLHRVSTNNSNNTSQVEIGAVAGGEQVRRTVSPSNSTGNSSNNSSNRNDLLQQLRLITSQLSGSSTSPIASSAAQTPARTQPPSNHQTILRPEIPQSNVGISNTGAVVNNSSIGKVSNPIDVDLTGSKSNGANNCPAASGNDSQAELFPYILHGMLDDVERIGQTNIVSWNADGKSFRIYDPDAFVSFILGKYLKKYVGGIASRLTQFRSDLKDWGFEDAVDGNSMSETFTHHCFQKGQSNLCRYMRCGRKATEPSRPQVVSTTPPTASLARPVETQGQASPIITSSNVVSASNTVSLGNAAQLLLGQQLQQAKQQQVLKQQQALQLQALLNGVTNGNNPVATMSLIQLLMGQQQQQQSSPQAMAAASAIQRQQHKAGVGNPPTMINSGSQNQCARPPPMTSGLAQASAGSIVVASTPSSKQPVRQWNKVPSSVPQVKRTKPTGSASFKNSSGTTAARPAVSAKRAAFLNKRSKATGAAYRNPNKKQKRSPINASAAMVIKNRKRNVASKLSSALSTNKNGGAANINAFTLNDDFKEKAVSDLLFPWKLHDMLDETELIDDLKINVVSWQADGVSFNIHDKDRFVDEIIPRYFENIPKEWDSFLNILSSWGFVRFTSGTQKGAFIHRLLVKGKRSTCKQMRINGKTVSDWMKQHGQFLGRLHALLCFAEKQGKQDIVSWTHEGKKFRVHDPTAFMNAVFPMYFDSLTYSSFEQKLRRWGFMRSPANHQKIDKDTKLENATYCHPQFVRSKLPNLLWVKSDTKIPRTLQQHNFLVRLRVMLSDASRHGHQFVVSWAPHGKAFMIHDRPYFSKTIMPNYFKSKFTSFRQSLRNHGFAQLGGNGWDEGAYYHKLFLRDEPQLCQGLTQDQMKKEMPEWIPVEAEPNFYPTENVVESEVAAAAASMASFRRSALSIRTTMTPSTANKK
jgi:hypothetical protein